MADYPIEWLEEPMMADAPFEHWDALVKVCPIPLAGGENLATANDLSRANQSSWHGIMQPDICKWGGFSGVLPVARQAIASGKRYCPHSLGGGIGLAASAPGTCRSRRRWTAGNRLQPQSAQGKPF